MPVPDTSRPCALEAARCLGLPYREGFIKNRYIARTFIMPGQTNRKKVGCTRHFIKSVVLYCWPIARQSAHITLAYITPAYCAHQTLLCHRTYVASSTRSGVSSTARTSCWLTIRSCAARPHRRSCRSPGKAARTAQSTTPTGWVLRSQSQIMSQS